MPCVPYALYQTGLRRLTDEVVATRTHVDFFSVAIASPLADSRILRSCSQHRTLLRREAEAQGAEPFFGIRLRQARAWVLCPVPESTAIASRLCVILEN
jgi:hypothetical protein